MTDAEQVQAIRERADMVTAMSELPAQFQTSKLEVLLAKDILTLFALLERLRAGGKEK